MSITYGVMRRFVHFNLVVSISTHSSNFITENIFVGSRKVFFKGKLWTLLVFFIASVVIM